MNPVQLTVKILTSLNKVENSGFIESFYRMGCKICYETGKIGFTMKPEKKC